jgi:hypothetical protein
MCQIQISNPELIFGFKIRLTRFEKQISRSPTKLHHLLILHCQLHVTASTHRLAMEQNQALSQRLELRLSQVEY